VELISVTRTPDGLKAFLTIRDELAINYPTFDELREYLAGNGIVYGIDDAALQQMVRNKTCNFPTEVARGTPSIPATPGRIDILVDVSSRGKPKALAGGRVDHRDIGYVVNVRKNTPILRRISPVNGKEGKMVTGKPIGFELPSPVMIIPGKGTKILEGDSNVLVADVDGAVMVFQNGKAEVLTDKAVQGNIDYTTGNISFAGNLRIGGTVRSGFEVSAEGNVWVGGSVEDARVLSLADIEIVGGASGSGNGLIKCAGVLKTRHIQNLNVQAKDIVVVEDVVHCEIWAEATLVVKSVVGGTVCVGKSIEAESIGTEAEARTVVDLGGSSVLLKRKYDLLKELATITGEMGSLKGAMFVLVRDEMDQNGALSASAESRLDEIRARNYETLEKNASIQKEVAAIDDKLKNSAIPSLKASTVYPNTVVRSGALEKSIKEKLSNVIISVDQNEITVTKC
jgi:hypothetical protein